MYVQEIKEDLEEEELQKKKAKCVYIIVYWSGNYIRDKLHKICDSFSGNRHDVPNLLNIGDKIRIIKKDIEDAKTVYDETKTQLRNQLLDFDHIKNDNFEDEDAEK